jgi:hypothetical protein
VKKSDLFDHLVGAGKQRGRNSEAERVRGLEVNDQLEFSWCFDRQISGLRTSEYAIYIGGYSPIRVTNIDPVGYQPARPGDVTERVNCGKSVTRRQSHDQLAMRHNEGIRQNNETAVRIPGEFNNGGLEFGRITQGHWDWLHRERRSRGFDLARIK